MRAILVTILFLLISFAGCLEADSGVETGGDQDQATGEDLAEMPDRRFEPEIIIEAIETELQQGDTINITFDITDLHDYPFPTTFIDWNLTYTREPNPVLEGDANALPATYERVLHAEDFHVFRFFVDDGQGFKANKTIIIKVGDPEPVALEEILDNAGGALDAGTQIIEFTGSTSAECLGFALCWELGATACEGFMNGENNADCVWWDISADGEPGSLLWDAKYATNGPSDVDVDFRTSCTPQSSSIEVSADSGHDSGTIPVYTDCIVLMDTGGSGDLSITVTVEQPDDGDPWVFRDADGYCHATGNVFKTGVDDVEVIWVHDRGDDYSEVPGPGYVFGGGVWLYEESNGVPGLQLGGNDALGGTDGYEGCTDGDFVIF